MKKYKTIIIGAGPAGLRCAKILADNQEDFILLEVRKNIYRKICAGIYGLAGCPLYQTDYLALPDNVFQKKINKVIIVLGKRKKEVIMREPFAATINRQELSNWMYQEAQQAGAKIIFDSPISNIGDNYIISGGEKIFFDYLVGADGGNSIVRKNLGLKTCQGLGIQYWVKGQAEAIEIKLDPKNLGPHYSWFAPHKDIISIGTGGDTEIMPFEKMKENLLAYCQEKKLDVSSATLEGASIGYCYQGYKFNNKFLIGDAGGFTSSLTGEGIYPAIASGEDVAKIIIDKNHRPILIEKILAKKRQHEIILKYLKNKHLIKTELSLFLWLLNFNYFKKKVIKLVA